ncbi:MAG: hypothetical protein ABJA60_02110 [Nitrosospira sp.]
MGIFSHLFSNKPLGHDSRAMSGPQINPANGLPMLDDSSVDIAGNPFGCGFSRNMDPCGLGSASEFGCHANSFSGGGFGAGMM